MESNHQVAKGFWLTFGGGSLIAILVVAGLVWLDSTNSSGGSSEAAPPAATTTMASTDTTATSTEMTETTAASTETETETETEGTTTAASTTGGSSTASTTAGKTVFQSNCASCHTLENADAGGQVGPNLDDLKPSAEIVKHQVENGGGGMPSFSSQLSAKQIQDVANYVAAFAGKGGGSGLPTGGAP